MPESVPVSGNQQAQPTLQADPQPNDAALAKQAETLGVSLLAEVPEDFDRKLEGLVSEEAARRYGMVPFRRTGNTLFIAMLDPQNFEALNVLRFLAEKERMDVEIQLTSQRVFTELIKKYTEAETVVSEAIESLKKEEAGIEKVKQIRKAPLTSVYQDAPIAKLVEVIVQHAIDGRASDIHIEPVEASYRVRFRVDGVLRSQLVFPVEVGRAVISRVKILANLKIDEKRKPQDGRIRFTSQENVSVDLRVSSLPVMEGEKVVMRVLDRESDAVDLDSLGLWGYTRKILEEKIRTPFGIILITGPTGSGKSTTLYAFLQILNQEERNIITLEDPVEYYLEGVNQSQIRPEIGYTFANGLRSILRQDPNVIMVGEIRDSETAELTIHAALTGHLVLSTLHTNNAIGAIPRLVDMGIETFLLASSLEAVAAQRLVRRICPDCKVEEKISDEQRRNLEAIFRGIPDDEKKSYELSPTQPIRVFKGKGCDACGKTGYKGRIAIYEVVDVDDTMREIIADKKGAESEVSRAAKAQGMITMKQDGILKVLRGITTLTEVERVTEGKLLVDEE